MSVQADTGDALERNGAGREANEQTVQGPSEGTRERIVQVARELVIERGYAGLSTAEVLRRAGVSRGGLYHHFSGKAELLAAILEALELDVVAQLAEVVADAPDQLTALQTGIQWYLDECIRSTELQRIGLVEGRKALGWEAWREVISPHGLSMLSAALAAAMHDGEIATADPDVLAHLILAALHESTALILSAADQSAERQRAGLAMAVLIDGLRSHREPETG
jgi:AcrR family transcriptional regulator